MSKHKLSLKKEKKTKKQLLERVRKEGRYSPITTITMWLLKEMNKDLYQNEKKIAQLESITTQKNYYFSVLRISMVYTYLLEKRGMTSELATDKIFGFIQSHLRNVIQQKYGNTNPKLFLQMVYKKNLHDLRILRKVFKSQTRDLQKVQSLLFGLYEQSSIKQHRSELKKIAQIVIKYGSVNKGKQKEEMIEQKQSTECLLDEQDIPEVLGCQKTQCGNCKEIQNFCFEELGNWYLCNKSEKNEQIMLKQNQADIKRQQQWNRLLQDLYYF